MYKIIDKAYRKVRIINHKEKTAALSYHDIAIAKTNFSLSWKFGSYMEDVFLKKLLL